MNGNTRIGLSHVIPEKVPVVHSTVNSRKAFGRISDLMCAWAMEECGLTAPNAGALRILISALLESLPDGIHSPTRIEMAIHDRQVLLAVRMAWEGDVAPGGAEKEFTQHWLHSEQMRILRRTIDPRDRIEVRFHHKTRALEWRVVRNLSNEEIDPALSSFSVFEDQREDLSEPETDYKDLGDLPFQEWLEESYRDSRRDSMGGTIRVKGEVLQGDLELARIKVSRELDEVERVIPDRTGEQVAEEDDVQGGATAGLALIDDLLRRLKKSELIEGELESVVEQLKGELRERRKELSSWKRRYQQAIDLLNRKEMALYAQANEMRTIQAGRMDAGKGDQGALEQFREKAIQMFEKLKNVTLQNDALRKELHSLRENPSGGVREFESATSIRTNTEDLEKKLDRVQRSLEAEKAKASALLERALNAEKDSQGSAHLITDLETKVEHTLKTSMQYKKEIDSMKQKLVQADAEKNKVKNELLKAQAQIQTLMKRQAA